MVDLFNYFRRETTEVNIGAVPLGGPNSIYSIIFEEKPQK